MDLLPFINMSADGEGNAGHIFERFASRRLEVLLRHHARRREDRESDAEVDATFVTDHLRIGINSLKRLISQGLTLKHLKF